MNRCRRRRRGALLRTAAVLAAVAVLPGAANASTGVLDPSFGHGGISLVKPPPGYSGEQALALTADGRGRLIAAGSTENEGILLRRYLSDGSPDPSFGTNGRVETGLESEVVAYAVTVLRGGDILVAGGTETGLALVRYRSDGSQAQSFGRKGHVITPGGNEGAAALSLAVQPGGRILSGGYKIDLSGDWTGLVIGYRQNGSIDTRFAGDGRAELHTGPRTEVAISGVEILPSGKILVGGDIDGRLMLGRLLADGEPDRSFGGGDGLVLVDPDGDPRCACFFANAMTTAPGGRPVLAGVAIGPKGESSLLARFTPDGRLDRDFGRRGVVRTRRGSQLVLNDVTTQADGRITVTGSYDPTRHGSQVAVLRYLANGKLDRSFAHGGFFHRHIGLGSIGWSAITRPDDRIVVAGNAFFPAQKFPELESPLAGSRVLLMRFRP
jgi:uncharacterized delta-60 repeat protein